MRYFKEVNTLQQAQSINQAGPRRGVVRLNNRCCNLRATPHREGDLALLAVVHGQALEHQAAQPGTRAAAAGVVDAEALEA